jgi:hypothetical protein
METPEPIPAEKPAQPPSIYWQVDSTLRYLLAIELGYLCLLILGGAVSAVLAVLNVADSGYWLAEGTTLAIIGAPLLLFYLGNLACGLLGLILHIKEKVEGYPGTGHLLNWIFIIATAWIFLFFILILLPTLSGPSFID